MLLLDKKGKKPLLQIAALAVIIASPCSFAGAGIDNTGPDEYSNEYNNNPNLQPAGQQQGVEQGEVVRKGGGGKTEVLGAFDTNSNAGKSQAQGTRTTTKTTTNTKTTTVAPPPPKVIQPCELIDSCDKLDTLNMISSMQQRLALVQARKNVEAAELELQKIQCEKNAGCSGESNAPSLTSEEIEGLSRLSSAPKLAVASIYGRAGQYRAIIVSDGGQLAVFPGDILPGGVVVQKINEQAVFVTRNGNSYVLPVAGTGDASASSRAAVR